MINAMLTDEDLSDETKQAILSKAEQAGIYLNEAIDESYARDETSLFSLMGDDNFPIFEEIMQLLEAGYQRDIERAAELSQRLRDAITQAFKDGHLTQDEVSNIQSLYDEMNELMAMQVLVDQYVEQQRLLRKAQTVSLKDAVSVGQEAAQERDRELEELEQQYDREYARIALLYDRAIDEGWENEKTGTAFTEEDKNTALQTVLDEQKAARSKLETSFAPIITEIFRSAIEGSDNASGWSAMLGYGERYRQKGGMMGDSDIGYWNTLTEQYGANTESVTGAGRFIGEWVRDVMGGIDEVDNMIESYRRTLTDNSLTSTERARAQEGLENLQMISDVYHAFYRGDGTFSMPSANDLSEDTVADYQREAEEYWRGVREQTAAQQAMEENDAARAAAEAAAATAPPMGSDAELIQRVFSMQGMTSAYIPETQEVEVNVGADTGEFESAISRIEGYNGDTVRIRVAGDTSDIEGDISRLQNRTVRIRLAGSGGGGGLQGYAEGGRAVRASVFGEAGPEWAIPEEHSARTAELLDSARQASGFTWPELLSRTGGLNADANHVSSTIIYSPTINAQDSRGVDQALREDKDRFERWYEQKRMLEEAMAY